MVLRDCAQCGGPIRGRTARAKFCSYGCKERFHAAARRVETNGRLRGRQCVVCSAEIASRSGKAICCSKKCSERYRNERRQRLRREAWEQTKPICQECGQAIPAERRVGVLYCSWECKHKATGRRYRQRVPGYMRMRAYGLTQERYDEMLAAQDGRCAICRGDTPGGKGGWHVDHDHATDLIRGLLCHHCNIMLGMAHDDPARLRAAATYLERVSV